MSTEVGKTVSTRLASKIASRLWWGTGLALLTTRVLVGSLATGWTGTRALLTVLFVLWAIPSIVVLLIRLWRRLTYRIGVRLFLSYVLIGVMPFVLTAAMAALGGYILIGQYCSSRYAELQTGLENELAAVADEAVRTVGSSGLDAARRRLAGLRSVREVELPRVEWMLVTPEGTWRSAGAADLAAPEWAEEGTVTGPFEVDGEPWLAAVARRGRTVAAVLVPLDRAAAEAVSRRRWYEVRFSAGEVREQGRGIEVTTGRSDRERDSGKTSGEAPAKTAEPEGFTTRRSGEGLWRGRWIYFFRPGAELRRWVDGRVGEEHPALVTLLLTSPAEAAEDLFRSPYRLGPAVWTGFVAVSCVLFALYLVAVGVAVIQVLAVTRSTARLTRGTRRVEAGDLDHRIPVRRRDQLGDLALSFNRMTASVAGMLSEVAEKEKLEREMELAREIQQGLLPASELRHGPLSVHAFFRPAAAVGGDYFDLFPLEPGRLIVTAGDVAGHGLPTGLLMAMVKSAVAALLQEGHRGVDLLERLNRLLSRQTQEHRMVTLVAAELDATEGIAEITCAGHPPPFLLDARGEVTEVLLPSLPLGSRWREPPPVRRLELEPGSRLVLYSDGLTEAADPAGEPLGYDRLARVLAAHAGLPAEGLLREILREVEAHSAGSPQSDDWTLLVVERDRARPVRAADLGGARGGHASPPGQHRWPTS